MQKIQIMRLTKGELKDWIEYVIESTESHFQHVGFAQTYEEALTSINEILELNKEDFTANGNSQ